MLTNPQARRLFLASHALAEAPTLPAKPQDIGALIHRIGFVQVDSINTVARAHHMILWSRRNAYRPETLDKLLAGRQLFEHWTHDASIIPTEFHPHWHHRYQEAEARLATKWASWFRPGYEEQFQTILQRIRDEGPLTVSDVGQDEDSGQGGWWDWKPSKTALEWLWRTGALAITRREAFRKVYDLTERVIPEAHRHPSGTRAEMIDWACNSALDRLTFADPSELRAYWHIITPVEAKAWADAALKRGEVTQTLLQGADGTTKKTLTRPETLTAAPPEPPSRLRILSPFDPALRDRDRAEFLFGFRYRIEVFVPEPKRQYGYYVFPVLEGDRLIARLDAKARRDQDALHLRALWPEPGITFTKARQAKLDAELARLAQFAGLSLVTREDDWLR
ncbi:winged helix-turn-helix domain-containing protein [Stagnihabitans tardus]|uniref:Winged helix-turn-helix domain-containing protein n=1 Tax=Stagnihabitans tardus TaxID=2699202 RepID=A0AAE5BUZ8_9RHOB|nr:crosslink repair DNA glycosylase YcaQ family protein [Stagnihabitans tardus]NBZ86658.1 winged helix-turn-helix domain-containing protein [Stagnihabitans tardus]